MDNIYKHFAVLAALAYWPAAIYMVRKWPKGRQNSFSLHAAANKHTRMLFAMAVTLETALYMLFAFKWFIPNFGMPFVFGLLIAPIAGLHFIAGIIPETKGLSKWIHRKASYLCVVLFIPAFFIIATTHTISPLARILAGGYDIWILALWYVYITQPDKRQEDLVYQSIYISSLPITLIAATYLR